MTSAATSVSSAASHRQGRVRAAGVPVLAAAVGLFWAAEGAALHGAGLMRAPAFAGLLAWLAALLAWGGLAGWLAWTGRASGPAVLRLLPGLWMPTVPLLLTGVALAISPALREAAGALLSGVADRDLLLLQALRVAALGSVLKARQGVLPKPFAYGLGVPDALFGLSALGLAAGAAPEAVLLAWNLAGAAIFLAAVPVLQLGLPGPLQVFRGTPDGRALLAFPMIVAPALAAPLLLLGNLLHAGALFMRLTGWR